MTSQEAPRSEKKKNQAHLPNKDRERGGGKIGFCVQCVNCGPGETKARTETTRRADTTFPNPLQQPSQGSRRNPAGGAPVFPFRQCFNAIFRFGVLGVMETKLQAATVANPSKQNVLHNTATHNLSR